MAMRIKALLIFFFLLYCGVSYASTLTDLQAIGTVSFFVDYSDSSLDADYSVGSGTASYSVTRTGGVSTGSYYDADGNVVMAAASDNTPRFTQGWMNETGFHTVDDYGNPIVGYLNEPATTNLATYTESFENEAWTKSNITADDSDSGSNDIYGDAGTSSLTATASDGTILQTYSGSATRYTFSVFMKRKTGTGPVYISVDNGTSWTWCELSSTEWRRFKTSITYNRTTTDPTAYIKISTSGDAIFVSGAQIEAGETTSYIPILDGTALARASGDYLVYTSADNRTAGEETIGFEYYPLYNQDTFGASYLLQTFPGGRNFEKLSAGETWRFYPNTSDNPTFYVVSNNKGSRNLCTNIFGVARIAENPESTADIYSDGRLESSETTSGQWTSYSGTIGPLRIARRWDGSAVTPMILQKFVIFSEALSDSEVAQAASILNNSYPDILESNTNIINTDGLADGFAASRVPNQKDSFYAQGRYWVFYADDNASENMDFVFTSSTDGITWDSPTSTGAIVNSAADAMWTIYFDGTYVHYSRGNSTTAGQSGMSYRKGLPNSDGSITWQAAEQLVIADTASVNDQELTVDSEGHPIFTWFEAGGDNSAHIIMSTTTDGTWSTKSGYPKTLEANVGNKRPCLVPMPLSAGDAGDLYVGVYFFDIDGASHLGHGYFYDYSEDTFTLDSDITDANVLGTETGLTGTFVARAVYRERAGIIYLVYQDDAGLLRFKYRATNGTWSDEEIFAGQTSFGGGQMYSYETVDNDTTPQVSIASNGDVYVIWDTIFDGIFLKKRNADGTWDETIHLINQKTEDEFCHVHPMEMVENNSIGIKWVDKNLNVMYSVYSTGEPTITVNISGVTLSGVTLNQ